LATASDNYILLIPSWDRANDEITHHRIILIFWYTYYCIRPMNSVQKIHPNPLTGCQLTLITWVALQ